MIFSCITFHIKIYLIDFYEFLDILKDISSLIYPPKLLTYIYSSDVAASSMTNTQFMFITSLIAIIMVHYF
jgi:hypothetical protein